MKSKQFNLIGHTSTTEEGSQERSRRIRVQAINRLTDDEKRIAALLYPERAYWRPKTRRDCASVPRPCPYVGCRYNTYLDVTPAGSLLYNYDNLEPWDVPAEKSCVLDQADEERTLEEVGDIFHVSRERIRQIEQVAFNRIAPKIKKDDIL